MCAVQNNSSYLFGFCILLLFVILFFLFLLLQFLFVCQEIEAGITMFANTFSHLFPKTQIKTLVYKLSFPFIHFLPSFSIVHVPLQCRCRHYYLVLFFFLLLLLQNSKIPFVHKNHFLEPFLTYIQTLTTYTYNMCDILMSHNLNPFILAQKIRANSEPSLSFLFFFCILILFIHVYHNNMHIMCCYIILNRR